MQQDWHQGDLDVRVHISLDDWNRYIEVPTQIDQETWQTTRTYTMSAKSNECHWCQQQLENEGSRWLRVVLDHGVETENQSFHEDCYEQWRQNQMQSGYQPLGLDPERGS